MIASLENINKIYQGNFILKNISLTIEDHDRLGLIGVNGCGKSTLLRILTGREQPDVITTPEEESCSISKDAAIGFLEQNSGLDRSSTIWEEMKSAFSSLQDCLSQMRALEGEMASGISHDSPRYQEISTQYAKLSTYFEANEGYLMEVKIRTVLNGMGFPPDRDDTVISTLSGGEKTRLALCRLLLESPSLLILDEPTNHLDFQTIAWLEDYLQGYKGALLIVSHDRYFLDRLCTSVAEIELGRLTRYKGNYTAFVSQKEAAVARQLKEYEQQQAEIAKLQEYVDKNLVRASTTAMAQSRRRQLEKMERIEKPVTNLKTAKLRFPFDIQPPQVVLTAEHLDLAVGIGDQRKILAQDLSFVLRRGEKCAIVGPNGVGKTTLLRVLLGKLPRTRGYAEWAKNVKISYFDQENAQLHPNMTVFDELHSRYPSMSDLEIRSALGAVRLVGENVFKQVGVISGGERAKLCFAIIMQEKSNVLLLDEPTNHLDLATKEVLEEALEAYEGTMLFVSHDRYFMERIADKIWEISPDGLEVFPCRFDEYSQLAKAREQSLQQAREQQKQEAQRQADQGKGKSYRGKEQRAAAAQRKQRIRFLEKDIDDLQLQINALNEQMTDPAVCADYQRMEEICGQAEELKQKMTAETDEWILLCEEDEA